MVFSGPNGSGKTNILEAVSYLVPGRGLRGARLAEVRDALGRAGDDVALRTAAEEEVERLLRGGDESDS